jgi:hypothetical protein
MEDDAGGIDDVAEGGAFEGGEGVFDAGIEGRPRGGAAEDFGAKFLQGAADFGCHQGARESREGGEEAFEHFMHGG